MAHTECPSGKNVQHRFKIEKSRCVDKALSGTLFIVLLLLCLSHPLRAGGDLREPPPRSRALGGAGCALPSAGLTLLNPALLASEPAGGLAFWTPARFGMRELGAMAAEWRQPLSWCAAGIAFQRFGFEAYNEHRMDVSLAREIVDGCALGIRGVTHSVHIQRYGNAIAVGLDAGIHAALGETWHAGAVVRHLAATSFAEGESLPFVLTVGAAWITERVRLLCDIEKEARYPVTVRAGIEFLPMDLLALRVGAVNAPASFAAGMGVLLTSVEAQYAVSIHPDLGWTHSLGIGFRP
ncbi:MAG: hypothetical protein JXA28_04955 [Bacteroidetes bacterium]|nr:hypothetical protein [Bacteroidota bacterium]